MGTRGVCGFHKNGTDKIMYNHYDSYFGGLGNDVIEFCKSTSVQEMNNIFDKIILVKENDTPTNEQITECKKYVDTSVGEQTLTDWYCLLREAQGNLNAYKDDIKYMIDYARFLGNSLFCEYGYVINLDTNKLEIYVGFNKVEQNNRYSKFANPKDYEGYAECILLTEFDLDDIPLNWENILNKKLEKFENKKD